MGFWDTITDMAEAVAPWSVASAEAPPAEEKTEESKVRSIFRGSCQAWLGSATISQPRASQATVGDGARFARL